MEYYNINHIDPNKEYIMVIGGRHSGKKFAEGKLREYLNERKNQKDKREDKHRNSKET